MPQNLMGVVRLTANPTAIVARILPLDDSELFNPCWTKFQLGTGTQPALEIVLVTRPAIAPQNYTRIFLYAVGVPGTDYYPNTFPNPGNWNPTNNRVEVVGAGEFGHPTGAPNLALEEAAPGIPVQLDQTGGGGGGGGAFGWATNIPATFPVSYVVWNGRTVPFGGGWTCVWGSTQYNSPPAGPGVVYAGIGYGGQYGAPGFGGQIYSPQGFAGGNGGGGGMGGGGGGGGAAGPVGAGSNATAGTATTFGNGGSANGGTSSGGTTGGAAGVSGIEWGIAGVGGGGAGSLVGGANTGGNGGLYGGGAGGGRGGSGAVAGVGGDGLIVITYVPLPSGMQAQIIG